MTTRAAEALRDAPGGGELPDGFLDLPHSIYAGDPSWIPEEPAEVAALFGPGNRWFEQGRAHAFCVPGLARAAAFRPARLEVDDVPSAFFGYWESAGDDGADALVMDAVRGWAAAAGARRLYGPIAFSTALDYRVRLAGGEGEVPYVGEPYNPLSYSARLEALGLRVHRRYFSQVFDADDMLALTRYRPEAIEEIRRRGYSFEPLTVEAWLANADALFGLANEVFADNFAFTPFSREAFDLHFGASWAARLDPEITILAYGPEGDIAGFCLTYPHYGPLVVQGRGDDRVRVAELNHSEHAPLLDELGPRVVVMKTSGTALAHRGVGLGHALAAEGTRRALERGVTSMFGGPIREDNPNRRVFAAGHRSEHWYGLYACDLETA